MSERSGFKPEEWGDHHNNDDCPWEEKPDESISFYRNHFRAQDLAVPVLRRFLAQSYRLPIKTFSKGDEIHANQLPNESILRFTTESVILGENTVLTDPYQSHEYWGVVCVLSDRLTVLMTYYKEHSSARQIFPGFLHRGSILPETVIHRRFRTGSTYPDILLKDTDVKLFSSGKVIPEKKTWKLQVPNFGQIFGRPIFNPI